MTKYEELTKKDFEDLTLEEEKYMIDKDVYTVMCDIDNWYMGMFKEGCVRFEFD